MKIEENVNILSLIVSVFLPFLFAGAPMEGDSFELKEWLLENLWRNLRTIRNLFPLATGLSYIESMIQYSAMKCLL
jgi:hypothetical protein